jgi:ATP-dependent Clp protease ATP-binding subunit ClpA
MARVIHFLNPTKTGDEAQALLGGLRQRIVGQDEAVDAVAQVYQMHLAGMTSPTRPIANLLFLGPTGSGKTRVVEATAEALIGDAKAVIKIDCGEFQHSHEIAKLVGSPPGYLGHRETHAVLSQETLNQHHTEDVKISFVLFDEIEKASDALWNLLLGILDKATLTLGDNRRVDFSRSMIFMTGNVGANTIGSILRPNIGFAAGAADETESMAISANLRERIARAGLEAARRKFTPEFLNRIDRTIVFRPLGRDDLRAILSLELNAVQQRILRKSNSQPFMFKVTASAGDFLLREGSDLKYGARHLMRAIERRLVLPLSNLIATQQVKSGDLIWVDFDAEGDALQFWKDANWKPSSLVANWAPPAPGSSDREASSNAATDSGRWMRARNVK